MKKIIKRYLLLFMVAIIIQWLLTGILFNLKTSFSENISFNDFYRNRWMAEKTDVPSYVFLAENGYQQEGEKANLIVFYPLYPFLIKIVSFFIRDYFWSGVLISNICLGLSVCFLYELIVTELGKEKALDGISAYVLYPFGFFLISVFTESLFIMLSTACLLCIKKKKWLLAGLLGMLSALTRTQGVILLLPAIYDAIVEMREQNKFIVKTLWVWLIPIGTLIYLMINKMLFGNFFAFIQYQAAPPWYNTAKWITENISNQVKTAMKSNTWAWTTYWVQLFLYFIGMIAMFYGLHKKVDTALIAYGGAYIFVSYIHGWLYSGARYMMGCVILYIVFASIENPLFKKVFLVLEGILLVLYTYSSMAGYSIV